MRGLPFEHLLAKRYRIGDANPKLLRQPLRLPQEPTIDGEKHLGAGELGRCQMKCVEVLETERPAGAA
jgi:hypothetical protein